MSFGMLGKIVERRQRLQYYILVGTAQTLFFMKNHRIGKGN